MAVSPPSEGSGKMRQMEAERGAILRANQPSTNEPGGKNKKPAQTLVWAGFWILLDVFDVELHRKLTHFPRKFAS
jgi:hypothetical protein